MKLFVEMEKNCHLDARLNVYTKLPAEAFYEYFLKFFIYKILDSLFKPALMQRLINY